MWRCFVIAIAAVAISLGQPLPSNTPGLSQPRLIHKVEPNYSAEARSKKWQGTVYLQGVVGTDGIAHELRVTRGLGYGLDENAIEAVLQWRFSPGTKDGVAVPVIATFQINFRLLDNPPGSSPGARPQVLKRTPARYTDEARKKKIQGRVGLRVMVGADGAVKDVQVLSSLDPGLDRNAIEAVKTWEWEPAHQSGASIDAVAMVDVIFNLGSASDEFLDHTEANREAYNKGVHYLNGDGVEKDLQRARAYFTKAADQGLPMAQVALAQMMLHGEAGPEDDLGAFNLFKKAADQRYAKAQYFVGLMYTEGKGTWKDDTQALRWYRLAAQQNEPAAEAQVGWAFDNARGVNADRAEAMKWYRRSADHGYARARFLLGLYYRDGTGVEKDPVEALTWMRLAISKDVPDAQVEAAKLANTLSKEQLDRVDALVKERSPKP
jgi:TonB family protein